MNDHLDLTEPRAAAPTLAQTVLCSLARLGLWLALAGLAAVVLLQLAFFAVHAAHLLRYPYPLDYGEGPLLAQVDLLRAGTPIWRLYADPDLPPYTVVNYPPVYHLVAAALAVVIRNTLLAGRLVELAAALASVAALWLLADEGRRTQDGVSGNARFRLSSFVFRLLIVLSFLGLPIVREWAVLMRVDLLGVCLGLWALVIVQRAAGRAAVVWAALPLALSLLVKPSLIAAPAAALIWLLFRDWRRAVLLGGLTALIGAAVVGLMQLGSGGWFLLHVLSANANTWDHRLAYGFWHDQMLILWPLVAAAALSMVARIVYSWRQRSRAEKAFNPRLLLAAYLLPVYYTLFGAIVAYGVGKVGAYTNYFLELYAGLIWLAALAARRPTTDDRRTFGQLTGRWSVVGGRWSPILVVVLVATAQLRYYPTWSETYLKLAGIIEGRNPPRVIVGGYGVWQDLRRERDILATLGGINSALDAEVRPAGAPIFTDVPGVAAQSGQLARAQLFEYRQLLDTGLADQSGLLRDLANGRVPLVVLDYLGNWLTPEMITLITHRYAEDGSRGTYDLYRPIDPGPQVAAAGTLAPGLQLTAYHLAASPGRPAYHSGETVLLGLDLRASATPPGAATPEVVTQLLDSSGRAVLEVAQPLLYGALPPSKWGDQTMQHLQPIALPPEIPPGTYQLAIALRASGRDLAPPQALAPLEIEAPAGRQIGEQGYYVPAPLLDAWRALGGDDPSGPGDPLTPAVPFAGFTGQCFVRACLRFANNAVQRVPLGELVQLADVGLRPAGAGSAGAIGNRFREFYAANGGAETFGPPLTPELIRGDQIVQYTRYARLERPIEGGEVRAGRLGEEYLRLPGGVPYRWPSAGERQ